MTRTPKFSGTRYRSRVRLIAGVVTFNPNVNRLRQNVAAIHEQVDNVLIVDNGSRNVDGVREVCQDFRAVSLLTNSSNRGMSVALNQLMHQAADLGVEHVLLLDQDSVAHAGMVEALRGEIAPGVAMVGAYALDRNLGDDPPLPGAPPQDVDSCITAGSVCRVEAWQDVQGYDERLFIDFVDFDFCLRLRLAGWRIRISPRATFQHEVGRARVHGRVVAYNHSAFRNFHLAKDMLLYARIHRGAPKDLMVEPRGVLPTVRALIHRMRTIARFEEQAPAKVGALAYGVVRGLTMRLSEKRPDVARQRLAAIRVRSLFRYPTAGAIARSVRESPVRRNGRAAARGDGVVARRPGPPTNVPATPNG